MVKSATHTVFGKRDKATLRYTIVFFGYFKGNILFFHHLELFRCCLKGLRFLRTLNHWSPTSSCTLDAVAVTKWCPTHKPRVSLHCHRLCGYFAGMPFVHFFCGCNVWSVQAKQFSQNKTVFTIWRNYRNIIPACCITFASASIRRNNKCTNESGLKVTARLWNAKRHTTRSWARHAAQCEWITLTNRSPPQGS